MKKYIGMVSAMVIALAFGVSGVAVAGGNADNGAGLFKSKKCKTCHNLSEKKKVGPGLKGVTKSRSEGWLTKWIKDPQGTWTENDAETQKLKAWKKGRAGDKKTKMKPAKVTDQDVADLVAFLKKNDG